MSDRKKPRSLSEIVNDVLRAVRDYYDSEYVYYIEKEYGDIETIFEWCAENVPWQRDKIKMLPEEQQPKWMKQEITNSTEADYSVSLQLDENTVAILAAVGVHRGGCDVGLLRTVIPYIPQAITLHKLQKQQEYLSYHDNLTGVLNRNSFVAYLDHVEPEELKTLGALSVDINGLKNFNKEFGRDYGDEVVTRVGEVLSEYFHNGNVYRMTGDEYLVLVENASYEDFTQQVHGAYTKLENISLGLVSVGYAWGKVDIDVNGLVISAENMMREEKKKYYKNLRKGHHEPIIKKDLLEDIEQKNFIVCLVPKIDVQTGEIAEDLTYYFATSEQVASSVGLGVLMNHDNTVRQAGGFIIQLMPGASEAVISALEEKIKEIHSITTLLDVGNTPETILQYILGDLGLEINEKLPAKFTCNCNKSRIEKALISVGKKDIQEMIDDGKPIEVNCHFCNKNYTFDVEELKEILEKARR